MLASIAKSALQIALGPFQRSAEQDLKHSFQNSSKVFINRSTSWTSHVIRSHGNEHIVSSEGLDCVTEKLGMHFVKEKKKADSFLPSQQVELAHQQVHQRVIGPEGEKAVWSRAVAERSQVGVGGAASFLFSNGEQLDWLSFNVDTYPGKT